MPFVPIRTDRNMMDANWTDPSESNKPSQYIPMIGMGLLVVGVIVACWVITMIYALLTGDGTKEMISNLMPLESLTITIKGATETLTIPDSFYYVVGLILTVLLLAISGGIAKSLITNGVKLIQPNLRDATDQIRKDLLVHLKKTP